MLIVRRKESGSLGINVINVEKSFFFIIISHLVIHYKMRETIFRFQTVGERVSFSDQSKWRRCGATTVI